MKQGMCDMMEVFECTAGDSERSRSSRAPANCGRVHGDLHLAWMHLCCKCTDCFTCLLESPFAATVFLASVTPIRFLAGTYIFLYSCRSCAGKEIV